ncbi:thioesterase family protein [Gammaproteobacteria bacterium]|nr:thioesterase family protein [Gammaproteobacteria bacterium]
MNSFNYKSEAITVTSDMCDHNGHMNVNYYYKLFDSVYTSMYIDELGFDDAYLSSGFSTFTLEDSIRYLNEFKLGEKIYPSFHLYNVNKKLLHFIGILQNEKKELAAIFETVLGHVDLKARKVTEFNNVHLSDLLNYKNLNMLDFDLPFEVRLMIKDI